MDDLIVRARQYVQEQKFDEALKIAEDVLKQDETHLDAQHIQGLSLLRLGMVDQAIPTLQSVAARKPNNGMAQWILASAFRSAQKLEEAFECFERALSLGVKDYSMMLELYDVALVLFSKRGNWRQYARIQQLSRQALFCTNRWLVGESTLASPYFNNAMLLSVTRRHAKSVLANIKITKTFDYQPPQQKIRLGFVGCDFCDQATSYLMIEFLEKLDRKVFEIFAYDYEKDPQGEGFRQRIIKAFDTFVLIESMSDDDAAQRINDDKIDVLFSIKNPVSARLGIFARRPAPIQIHYLYYPGTSGMPFFDYIIADDFVIPPEFESSYQEKVLRLPCCYQPNDSGRYVPADTERSCWGIPEDVIIMANFNQLYKLAPHTIDVWCALLARDKRRILWLMEEDEVMISDFLAEVMARGIDYRRIYFGHKLPTWQHLSRMRHVDLIVDTFPCGGHTLASDSLWSGTPFITLCGETFASRVGGSLLRSVGMDWFITYTEHEYIEKADEFLNDVDKRKYWRRYLDLNRHRFSLFDGANYAHQFGHVMSDVVKEYWQSTVKKVVNG